MSTRVRPAAAGDADAVLSLLGELGYTSIDAGRFATTFRAVLAHPEMRVLVAEQGDAVVGLVTIAHRAQLRLAGRIATIDELVVAARARGQGVGRALLEEAKRFARELGAVRVEVHTARARENYARGFYAKNGFVEAPSAIFRLPGG